MGGNAGREAPFAVDHPDALRFGVEPSGDAAHLVDEICGQRQACRRSGGWVLETVEARQGRIGVDRPAPEQHPVAHLRTKRARSLHHDSARVPQLVDVPLSTERARQRLQHGHGRRPPPRSAPRRRAPSSARATGRAALPDRPSARVPYGRRSPGSPLRRSLPSTDRWRPRAVPARRERSGRPSPGSPCIAATASRSRSPRRHAAPRRQRAAARRTSPRRPWPGARPRGAGIARSV